MSHFYASIQGSRGKATRQGTASSGICGHIRSWDAGVEVIGFTSTHLPESERFDCFDIYMTAGSNGGLKIHLGQVRRRLPDGHLEFIPSTAAENLAIRKAAADRYF